MKLLVDRRAWAMVAVAEAGKPILPRERWNGWRRACSLGHRETQEAVASSGFGKWIILLWQLSWTNQTWRHPGLSNWDKYIEIRFCRLKPRVYFCGVHTPRSLDLWDLEPASSVVSVLPFLCSCSQGQSWQNCQAGGFFSEPSHLTFWLCSVLETWWAQNDKCLPLQQTPPPSSLQNLSPCSSVHQTPICPGWPTPVWS